MIFVSSKILIITGNNLNAKKATEHPYATDVEWDPTGRYVVTYVSAWIRPSDNEYQVWSFLGRRIRKESKLPRLVQFQWRPRMPSLLDEKEWS